METALFCHDMAFYIGERVTTRDAGTGKGYFFRTDKESSKGLRLPESNNDLSTKGNHLRDVSAFFKAINEFQVIYTDRLHVSIAGCLLGKQVHLYPGAYFKNRAVYESSMRGNFEKVHFHDDFDFD